MLHCAVGIQSCVALPQKSQPAPNDQSAEAVLQVQSWQ
jgi:hypothetical protein